MERRTEDRRSEDQWHLDKKVPITILLALAINAFAGIWWASKLESRIERVEQLFLEQRSRDSAQDQTILENRNERNQRFNRIEDKLDRLITQFSERPAK